MWSKPAPRWTSWSFGVVEAAQHQWNDTLPEWACGSDGGIEWPMDQGKAEIGSLSSPPIPQPSVHPPCLLLDLASLSLSGSLLALPPPPLS